MLTGVTGHYYNRWYASEDPVAGAPSEVGSELPRAAGIHIASSPDDLKAVFEPGISLGIFRPRRPPSCRGVEIGWLLKSHLAKRENILDGWVDEVRGGREDSKISTRKQDMILRATIPLIDLFNRLVEPEGMNIFLHNRQGRGSVPHLDINLDFRGQADPGHHKFRLLCVLSGAAGTVFYPTMRSSMAACAEWRGRPSDYERFIREHPELPRFQTKRGDIVLIKQEMVGINDGEGIVHHGWDYEIATRAVFMIDDRGPIGAQANKWFDIQSKYRLFPP